MSIRRVTVNGRKCYQARVAVQGARKSKLCASKDEARQAEADLLTELQAAQTQAAQEAHAPATLALLCDAYMALLKSHGKLGGDPHACP